MQRESAEREAAAKKPAEPTPAATSRARPDVRHAPAALRTLAASVGNRSMGRLARSRMLAREPAKPAGAQAAVDYVFIMGKDMSGKRRADDFYTAARNHFVAMKAVPTATPIEAASLEEIVETVEAGSGPVGNLYIVVHATPIGVEFGLLKSDTGAYAGRIWLEKLQAESAALGTRMAPKVNDRTVIRIRGCNVGRNQKFVKELHKALGGKGTFEAPTHRTSYDWETTGRKVTSTREYVAEFVVIFEDTPAHRSYKPADLAPRFAANYPDSGLTEAEWLKILEKVKPKAKRKSFNWDVDLDPKMKYTDAEIAEVMKGNLNEPSEFFYKVARPSKSKGVVTASQLRYEVPTKTVEKLTGKVRSFPKPGDKDYKTFMATDVAPPTEKKAAAAAGAGAAGSAAAAVLIDVDVLGTEDWLGKDEVYVKATGPGGVEKTRVVGLNDGQRHTFGLSTKAFADFSKPVTIEVYDEDSPDADDLIVRMTWSPPFSPVRNTRSYDEANYRVTARRA